jgi:hypothetical protein
MISTKVKVISAFLISCIAYFIFSETPSYEEQRVLRGDKKKDYEIPVACDDEFFIIEEVFIEPDEFFIIEEVFIEPDKFFEDKI